MGRKSGASGQDALTSPEQLGDYLRVTNSRVYIAVIALAMFITGALFLITVTGVYSMVDCTAEVRNGVVTVVLEEDENKVPLVKEGHSINIGNTSSVIEGIGKTEDGRYVCTGHTVLADGTYEGFIRMDEMFIWNEVFN